jgi:hypothetical protein
MFTITKNRDNISLVLSIIITYSIEDQYSLLDSWIYIFLSKYQNFILSIDAVLCLLIIYLLEFLSRIRSLSLQVVNQVSP